MPSQVALHRQEIARGILLLFVFYLHGVFVLVDHVGGPQAGPIAWFQNRLLAAHVALFFVLAGQSAANIGLRPLRSVLGRSLALLVLAAISHIPAVLFIDRVWEGRVARSQLLRDLTEPILLGTGYWTSVPWFFVVLAVTRLLAYAFVRSKAWFVVWSLAVAAAAWAGELLALTDNLYEWRNLPVALPLFIAGMYLPKRWSSPRWLVILAIIGAPLAAFANSPGAFHWPCFDCDRLFVQQPFVGEMGLAPLLFVSLAFGYCLLSYTAAVLVGSRIGRAIQPFGRYSLRFLLLHGWLLVTIYPFAIGLLPKQEQWSVFVGLFLILPPLHWFLFLLLRRPLSACYKFANQLSRLVVNLGVRKQKGASVTTARSDHCPDHE